MKFSRLSLIFLLFLVLILGGVFVGVKGRLEKLYSITTVDPLFYSPEIDTHKLKEKVDVLHNTEERVGETILHKIDGNLLTNTEKEIVVLKTVIQNGFIPNEYLKNLAQSIDKTRSFLESPSPLKAIEMGLQNYLTARSYKKESTLLYRDVVEANNASSQKSYSVQLLSSQVNNLQLENDSKIIKENGEELVRESRSRLMCTFFGFCGGVVVKETKLEQASGEKTPQLDGFVLLPDEVVNKDHLGLPRTGPYIGQSDCFSQIFSPFYLFKNDENGFRAKQANENYYFDFTDDVSRGTDNKYIHAFIDKGLVYDSQPEGADYRCTNLEYWGDLAIIDYFNNLFPKKNIKSLNDAENALVSEQSTDTEYDKNKTILENKMIDLPEMLTSVNRHLDLYQTLVEKYLDNVQPLYLLSIRSAYSLTYNTFSKSVWRLEESPTYSEKKNTSLSRGYISYHDLLKKYSDMEILSFHSPGREYIK